MRAGVSFCLGFRVGKTKASDVVMDIGIEFDITTSIKQNQIDTISIVENCERSNIVCTPKLLRVPFVYNSDSIKDKGMPEGTEGKTRSTV